MGLLLLHQPKTIQKIDVGDREGEKFETFFPTPLFTLNAISTSTSFTLHLHPTLQVFIMSQALNSSKQRPQLAILVPPSLDQLFCQAF